jgi:DnaJ-class molecular chaperone
MMIDVECQRCRGEGWLLRREPLLGTGLYEVTCDLCNGHGAVEVDQQDEVEDWMAP